MKKGDLFKYGNKYFVCEHKSSTQLLARLITKGILGNNCWCVRNDYKLLQCNSLLVSHNTIKRLKSPGTKTFGKVEINANKTAIKVTKNIDKMIRMFFKSECVYITYGYVTYNAAKHVLVLHNVTKC